MGDDRFRQQGEAAADFAKDLQAEQEALSETLAADREHGAIRRARWLIKDEFDADVEVLADDEADDDLAADAQPARPAIYID
jgi:leucyl-tRNA synthetase